MITLAEMDFMSLQAGMKFAHPEHGEQTILDLSRGQFGPLIQFHDSLIYSGELPQLGDLGEGENIFEVLASRLYPAGAEGWVYQGAASPEEIVAHGWTWQQVTCPHCGFEHRLLAPAARVHARSCRGCGMAFSRPSKPLQDES